MYVFLRSFIAYQAFERNNDGLSHNVEVHLNRTRAKLFKEYFNPFCIDMEYGVWNVPWIIL
jgi:hypothetical protein